MLEKIGLPPKPSLRGNTWVVDATHCQGCSSQFTFINRKHHCRRCGGLFCNSCTQERMMLRGQGDSPVRICEPCKKLEEAARFEMRHGHKNRGGKGGLKLSSKYEEEVLNKILGNDEKELVSSGQESTIDLRSSIQRATSSASCSNIQEVTAEDMGGEIPSSLFVDDPNHVLSEKGSATPEELRQAALDERKKYKTLKAEGKSEEALRAFKRGKELDRQAGALEIYIRKNRKKIFSSKSMNEIQKIKDDPKESARKNKLSPEMSKGKDDLATELRELGWSDVDLRDADRKPASVSLEGELSSLLGEVSHKTNTEKGTHGIDKSQVIAHKKKALALKREGKLAEAKEELKRAKVLEKQIEEQEFLADAEDSDEEFSSLMRSMGIDKRDDLLIDNKPDPSFDFNQFLGIATDIDIDGNFEVTDEDMDDPEIAAALTSLGWSEDTNHLEDIEPQFVPIDREALLSEISSLKREALNQKKAGNTAEAMALLKKAKVLERDLDSFESQRTNLMAHNSSMVQKGSILQSAEKTSNLNLVDVRIVNERKVVDPKLAPKSKLMIQKELLGLKKRALALRREGRSDEADEELKKGKVLEQQLEEMDNPSLVKVIPVNVSNKHADNSKALDIGDEADVTDQDMHDPTYNSLLRNLGWKDEDNLNAPSPPFKENDSNSVQNSDSSVTQAPTAIQFGASRKSKGEIQRELLGLKRKSLALRRQGEAEEVEEVLKMARLLEAQLAEMEAPKKEAPAEFNKHQNNEIIHSSLKNAVGEGEQGVLSNEVVHDPALLSVLKNLGRKDEFETVTMKPFEQSFSNPVPSDDLFIIHSSPETSQIIEDNHQLLVDFGPSVEMKTTGDTGVISPIGQSGNLMDLLTGDNWSGSQTSVQNIEDKWNFSSVSSSLAKSHVQVDSQKSLAEDLGSKDKVSHEEREKIVRVNEKPHEESTSTQTTVFQNDQSSPRQEILAHKRKAVILKREGKLAEAKEELRQAKLLEKCLEDDIPQLGTSATDVSSSNVASVGQKEHSLNLAPKPLSSRDRFKLQQESLGHKRQALKLRREGRTEEAEAEFELAKALETQLEELTAQNSMKSSINAAEPVDDVSVEDLLDPQLLSALKAIGLEDASIVSQGPERPESVKSIAGKVENSSKERIQLEEQIKAEKVKAVNLKRSGKQAEALDALRKAKLLQKKLNSLASH